MGPDFMDEQKVLLVGSVAGAKYRRESLLSRVNLDEFNVVIVQPLALKTEIQAQGAYLQQSQHKKLTARLGELVDWIRAGHTLIVLDPKPIRFSAITAGGVPSSHALEEYAPLDKVIMTEVIGQRVEACGNSIMADLLAPYAESLSYNQILEGPDFSPFLRVSRVNAGKPQIVGGYHRLGEGVVIYGPLIDETSKQKGYVDALIKLRSACRPTQEDQPAWTKHHQMQMELKANRKISDLQAQVEALNEQIGKEGAVLDEAKRLKALIVETGTPFANAVAAALTELGLMNVEGPHPRADILATDGRRYAAIEAKGVEGPVKEAHVRQALVWMAEVDAALANSNDSADTDLRMYSEQLAKLSLNGAPQEDCKGILVVGTYRKVPISERSSPDFGDSVVRVLARSDVCAMTGLQLLGLLVESQNDPKAKAGIVKEIFETKGVLRRASDWRKFITVLP